MSLTKDRVGGFLEVAVRSAISSKSSRFRQVGNGPPESPSASSWRTQRSGSYESSEGCRRVKCRGWTYIGNIYGWLTVTLVVILRRLYSLIACITPTSYLHRLLVIYRSLTTNDRICRTIDPFQSNDFFRKEDGSYLGILINFPSFIFIDK